MNVILKNKLLKLKKILAGMEKVLVAFSGGVDSTLLVKVAVEVLGPGVLAVTASSESLAPAELVRARKLARKIKVKLRVIKAAEMNNPAYVKNDLSRCYLCKKELFEKLLELARREKIDFVVEGSNVDDLADYRPGRRALAELGIASPFLAAGLNKSEVRELSRYYKLPTWNQPAAACLASRVPYGVKISPELLKKIGRAEIFLKSRGLKQLRVRDHGPLARIEVAPGDLKKIIHEKLRPEIVARFKKLGYQYVTLDIQGYRTGSLNEVMSR